MAAPDELPAGCSWLYDLGLFELEPFRCCRTSRGLELKRPRLCFMPGGFELDLSIPNQDPTTYSMWLVEGAT